MLDTASTARTLPACATCLFIGVLLGLPKVGQLERQPPGTAPGSGATAPPAAAGLSARSMWVAHRASLQVSGRGLLPVALPTHYDGDRLRLGRAVRRGRGDSHAPSASPGCRRFPGGGRNAYLNAIEASRPEAPALSEAQLPRTWDRGSGTQGVDATTRCAGPDACSAHPPRGALRHRPRLRGSGGLPRGVGARPASARAKPTRR